MFKDLCSLLRNLATTTTSPVLTQRGIKSESVALIFFMMDTHRTTALAPGVLGTFATLIAMADMVRGDARSVGCRRKAEQITSGISGHEPDQIIRALFLYTRDNVRYLKDPIDVELVHGNDDAFAGYRTIDQPDSGYDCDDKVEVLAALLGSVGIKSRFVIYSYDGVQWNHVALEARTPHGWVALDPTDPVAQPGDEQWNVARRTYDIWPDGLGLSGPYQPGYSPLQPPGFTSAGYTITGEAGSMVGGPLGVGYGSRAMVDGDPMTGGAVPVMANPSNPAQAYFPGAAPNPRLDRICNDPTLACVGGGGRYVKCLAAGYSPPCNPLAQTPQAPVGLPVGTSPQTLTPPVIATSTGIPTWVWLALGAIVLIGMRR